MLGDGSFNTRIGAKPADSLTLEAVAVSGYRSIPITKIVPVVVSDQRVAPNGYVSGIVVDAISGSPMAGVTVYARGVDVPVLTGGDGKFVLPVPGNSNWALFFKRIGFIDARRDISVRQEVMGQLVAWVCFAKIPVQRLFPPRGHLDRLQRQRPSHLPAGAVMQDTAFTATWIPTPRHFRFHCQAVRFISVGFKWARSIILLQNR